MQYSILAQGAQNAAGGFNIVQFILPVGLLLLIVFMFMRQNKARKQMQEQRSQMAPGQEVMTQFGLFGTIRSIEPEANKAVLELSPGNYATVHLQALTRVVPQDTPATDTPAAPAAREENLPSVPDDASSLTGSAGTASTPNTANPTDATGQTRDSATSDSASNTDAQRNETPEETLERIKRENEKNN